MRSMYRDAAATFICLAEKKEREAIHLDKKAERCRVFAEEQRKMAQEMIANAEREEKKGAAE